MTQVATRLGLRSYLRGSPLRRFARNGDGVSAVEFALVLPVMLSLYIGGVEVGDGMAINFKSTLAARTVTDLASQYVSIDNATMSSILGAASTVLTPYPTANVVVTVSEVTTNAQGAGTVTWSDSLNGTARTVGSSITLPTKLQSPNITILFGEVTYPYTPSMGYVLTGTINIYESVYFYPRMSTTIARVNS
jgi:Flp pilus assembly protein TadG